jgi:hypothetical protein
LLDIAKENDGIRYLLTVIDILSKFAWVIPVKSKSAQDIVNAFEKLLDKSAPRKPQKLQTDKGKEFLNESVQKLFKNNGIEHFTSESDQKAAVVERFNRTIKSKIEKFITAFQSARYIDHLDEFVEAYNHSYHRSIKMRPIDVNKNNQRKVWINLYKYGPRTPKSKAIANNTRVRISKVKGIFEKGYNPNWTSEHFYINANVPRDLRTYKLRDDSGEEVKGSWYKDEVQPIGENEYLIEKILSRKVVNKQKLIHVKWKGWPSKFNSWVPESDTYKL